LSSRDKTKKSNVICDALAKKFPPPPLEEDRDLVEAMLVAILLERVPRARAEQIIKRFQATFVNWNEMRVSTGTEIAEQAKESSLNERIARRLKNALHALYDNRWEFDLTFLKEESAANIRSYLVDTLGLEPRPAARVMLFDLGKPALPLSEEVRRVANRLGLCDPSWAQDRAQKSLERIVPASRVHEFSHIAQRHAEATCLADKPRCSRCLLRKICDFYAEQQTGGKTAAAKPKGKPAKKATKKKAAPKKTGAKKTTRKKARGKATKKKR